MTEVLSIVYVPVCPECGVPNDDVSLDHQVGVSGYYCLHHESEKRRYRPQLIWTAYQPVQASADTTP